MTKMKKFFAPFCVFAFVASTAACSFAADAFKIGGTGPLTGGGAIYGTAVQRGAQIAADKVNAEGEIKIDLRYEDDAGDSEKGVNAYNALKDWGMQLSLCSVTTKPAEAIAGDHFEDRIFALTPSASSLDLTEGKDNVFQMCDVSVNEGAASAHYIADKKLATKIAIIWQNDNVYSTAIRNRFVEVAAEVGLTIVSDTTFAAGHDTDFSVQLTDARKSGAELVFLPMYYQHVSLILAQAKSMGFDAKWFGVNGLDGILAMEGFDKSLAEGVMLLTAFNADSKDEEAVAFIEEYRRRHGETPNQFAADAYDCIMAYAQAIKNSGATPDMSHEELCELMIQQFTTMTYDGITSKNMTWGTDGRVRKKHNGMIIRNGVYLSLD